MNRTLGRLTAICLALPEAAADDSHPPHRGFRVAGKNFAWYTEDEHGDGRIGVTVRLAPGVNEELVRAGDERFGLPKYVSRYGWLTYYLDLREVPIDWALVERFVRESYAIQASQRLRKELVPLRTRQKVAPREAPGWPPGRPVKSSRA